jgi:hypothetical protein
MKLPIYELKINESLNDDSEVSYVALVDAPAIKKDFLAFNEQFIEPNKGEHQDEFMSRCIKYVIDEGKEQEQAIAICYSLWENHFATNKISNDSGNTLPASRDKGMDKVDSKFFAQSYDDYPQAASENAKIALRWAEENGWGDCGTPVGKIRANQLANREPISEDTISRMASFERHRQNSDKPLGDGCGRLMWLAWGGDEGIAWASKKLEQIKKSKFQKFQIVSEDQRIISGALMIADELIYRNNEVFGEHYVKFSAETIKQIAIKFAKRKYQNNVNLMHDPNQEVDGVTMFESFISDKERGIMPMKGFEDVADGSWFGSFYVENDMVWESIKNGEYKGFSVEGLFDYNQPISQEQEALNRIAKLLNEIK